MTDDLELAGVTKRFGSFTAVDDLTLTVAEGSFFALLGASGCGKTTTLRMVAGLEEPTAGRVRLGRQDVTGLRAYRRPVNTVFQSYALFPHLNVFDNVSFGLRRQRSRTGAAGERRQRSQTGAAGERGIKDEVERMLAMVQLDGFGPRRPAELSGGQQQRVALARALINRPKVLLLDEPLGALDLKLRRQMQVELKRIQTEVGITFVHVTHDQEEAMTMADTVAVMHAGRIEQLGAPTEMYEFPATAFVANFLGQSNLLPVTVDGPVGDLVSVRGPAGVFEVPTPRCRVRTGPAWLGVRPEKLHLVPGGAEVPAGHQSLRGVITDSSYMGVSTQYLVRIRTGEELTVFAPNSGVAAPLAVAGDVELCWRPEHAFLLERVAGEPTEAASTP